MYHNTDNWQEVRVGYHRSIWNEGSEIKILNPIHPDGPYEIGGGGGWGAFENVTPDRLP